MELVASGLRDPRHWPIVVVMVSPSLASPGALPAGLTSLVLLACSYVPPAPPGPLRGPGAQVGGTMLYSVEPTTLEMANTKVRGDVGGLAGFPTLPHRLALRFSPVEWFDLGADYSPSSTGADVRFGVPLGSTNWPWAVSIGGSTGRWRIPRETPRHQQSQELRARFELYPTLATEGDNSVGLLLSAGVGHGQRFANFSSVGPEFLLDGSRVEFALGMEHRKRSVGLQYGLMPFLSLGNPTASNCSGCGSNDARIEQPFGIVLFLGGYVFVPLQQ